jgi:hypothetical protein
MFSGKRLKLNEGQPEKIAGSSRYKKRKARGQPPRALLSHR